MGKDTMVEKRALVVDDSTVARSTLRRMLEKYQLKVDTVASAEEALDYLVQQYPHPNVVFMDHSMPGMDGLQAVKLIKDDPNTAMIPIMMYTSKEGEVYVGQARALGAVGVLTKEVKHVQLHNVLKNLHLVDEDSSPHVTGLHVVPNFPPVAEPDPSGADMTELATRISEAVDTPVRRQLKRMLNDHRAALGREMKESQEAFATRLAATIDAAEFQRTQTEASRVRPWQFAFWATLGLLLLALLVMTSMTSSPPRPPEPVVAADAGGVAGVPDAALDTPDVADDIGGAEEDLFVDAEPPPVDGASAVLFEAVEWAVNSTGQYVWGQVALGDQTLQMVSGLASRLASVDFQGVLRLEVHVGEFCLITNEAGERVLPPADLPLNQCDVIGFSREDSVALGERQSLGFANFLGSSPLLNDTGFEIEVQSLGNVRPLQIYPQPSAVETVGEWNTIAQRNNRLKISIIPVLP